jgi:hypothetical protein
MDYRSATKQFEYMLSEKRKEFKEKMNNVLDINIKLMMVINTKDLEQIKLHIEDSLNKKELDIAFLKTFIDTSPTNEITKYIKGVLDRINRDSILNNLGVE